MIAILAERLQDGRDFVRTLGVEKVTGEDSGLLTNGHKFHIITREEQLRGLELHDFFIAWPERSMWNHLPLVQRAMTRLRNGKT
jgi:hypothetical protein